MDRFRPLSGARAPGVAGGRGSVKIPLFGASGFCCQEYPYSGAN